MLGTAGCGFQPLHNPDAFGPASTGPNGALGAVIVGNIPERFGQLVRRDLQRRLDRGPGGQQARYVLEASIGFNVDSIGYRRDGTATRQRFTANGNWALLTLSVPPERIAGSAIPIRALDAYNIPDLQFFAADSSREAMEQRLAEVIAEEIVRQVTLALRNRPAGLV